MVTFCGLELEYGNDVLRPREETELLARTALAKLDGTRVIDVCCGAGNVACAIAANSSATVVASDLTDGCVSWARRNVERLKLSVTVVQGDLFANVPVDTYDLITCNPPYISTTKLATRDDLANEPREAFDGGPYGVTIHQRVAREALPLLRPAGWLCFEFGLGQERQLELVIQRTKGYDTIELFRDETGAPRVIAARRASS